MARRVFFSYHFQRDTWRANQVRNSWVTKRDREAAGYFDAADQEEVKRNSDEAIKRWINGQLRNTSVTAVLIGAETAEREFVRYEIERSFQRGNALLGIRIHDLMDQKNRVDSPGDNPLRQYIVDTSSGRRRLSDIYPTYDWKGDGGQSSMSNWVEEARAADRSVSQEWRNTLVYEEEADDSWADVVVDGVAIGVSFAIADNLASRASEFFNRRQFK